MDINDRSIHYTITAESDGERILKIGKHLPKLRARIKCAGFLTHGIQNIWPPDHNCKFLAILSFQTLPVIWSNDGLWCLKIFIRRPTYIHCRSATLSSNDQCACTFGSCCISAITFSASKLIPRHYRPAHVHYAGIDFSINHHILLTLNARWLGSISVYVYLLLRSYCAVFNIRLSENRWQIRPKHLWNDPVIIARALSAANYR